MLIFAWLLLEVGVVVSVGQHGPQWIADVVQIFQWSLGDNGTVDISNEKHCEAFKPPEGMFLSINNAPDLNSKNVQFVPAPRAVVDSCTVSSNLKAPVVLGEYDGSCISDPLFCATGSFTWAVWLKIKPQNQRDLMGLANLISAGNYDSFKSGFNLWFFRGELLLCTANNNKERSSIGVNMTYLIHEHDIQQGQWFHLVCSFNFSNHGVVAMMYFNGIRVQRAENTTTPDWDGFLDMQIQYNLEDNHIDNYLKLGKYIPPHSSNGTGWPTDDFKVSYSNLMVTDGILGPENIQRIYSCGSMDWDFKLRSLVWVTKETSPFTLQLVCTASAATGPSIAWSVYKSKLESWEDIGHDVDNGVRIKNRIVSSCVLTSTLIVENYRKRGYTESMVVCSTSTPWSGLHQSANVSVPGQPGYYQWTLGENGNVDVRSEEFCSSEVFNLGTNGVMDVWEAETLRMVPAPRVVENVCALKISNGLVINYVDGTCVANQRYCTSTGFTWSLWLRFDQVVDRNYSTNHSGSYKSPIGFKDQMFTFNLWVTRDRLLFCSSYNNVSIIARGINITDASFNNKWFHITCVFNFSAATGDSNSGLVKAYVNGIENKEQHEIDNLYFDDYEYDYLSVVWQYGDRYVILGTYFRYFMDVIDYSNLVVIDGVLEDEEVQHLHSCGSRNWELKLRSLVRVSDGISALTLQLVCTASDVTGPSITWRVYKSKSDIWDDVRDDEVNGVRIENHNLSSCVLTSTLTVTNYRKLGYTGSVVMCVAATPGRALNQSSTYRLPDQPEIFLWSLGDNGTVDVKSEDLCGQALFTDMSNGQQDKPRMVTAPRVVEDSCAVSIEWFSHVDLGDWSSTCVADYSFCVSAGFTWSVWLNLDSSLLRYNLDHTVPIVSSGDHGMKRSTFNLWATEGFSHLFCSANINNNTVLKGIKLIDVNLMNSWIHIACVFNLSSTVETGVVRAYLNALEDDGQYLDRFNVDHQSLGNRNVSLGLTIYERYLRGLAMSNLVVTDGPIGDEHIRGLYECGSLDWKLKLRSLVRVSNGVSSFTLQLVCTASAATGPSITWSVYKSNREAWEDIIDDEETGARIKIHDASSCVQTSTLTVENYRKQGYAGSAVKCTTSTPSSVSIMTANITIPDQPGLYKWSLGGNGSVDLINGESCNTAVFTHRTVVSYTGDVLPTSLIPAPQLVEDSCAVLKPKYSYIDLGNDKDSCVLDYRYCMSTGYTWSAWLKIEYVGFYYDRYSLSIISTGVDENSKFNFRLWLTRDFKYIVCTIYNKETNNSSNNTPYQISSGINVTNFIQDGRCTDCPWFHVACSVNFTDTEHIGIVETYINGAWINGSTDSFVHELDFLDNEVDLQLSGLILGCFNNPMLWNIPLGVAYSNLVLTDGFLGDDNIGHLYSCGSMEWGLKLRSLVQVSNGVSPFTLQLVCTASAATGPSIGWSVYKSKHELWEDVIDHGETGVSIENHDVSSCVLTSTLTITNYRNLGYSGSVLRCSALCPSSQSYESANLTIEDQPELYQWSLGSNGTVDPNEPCNTAVFIDDRVVSMGERNASLITAPQVVEESCAILKPEYSYIDLGNFKDTCVSDYRFCMSTGYTWSVWLKIKLLNTLQPTYHQYRVVSTGYDENYVSNFRLWITKDSKLMVCSASKKNTDSNITHYTLSTAINITSYVRDVGCTDCPWFHVACAVNLSHEIIKLYIDGIWRDASDDGSFIDDEINIGSNYEDTNTFNLQLGKYRIHGGRNEIAFSSLVMVDGILSKEGVEKLYSCGSMDWSLKVRSLDQVTKGVDQSHVRLVCTASAGSGPDIAWRIYHSQCNVWETLQNGTDDRVVIEMNIVSSCVQTSTLTILNYRDRLISGSIVMCLASTLDVSQNQSASFTMQKGDSGVLRHEWSLKVQQLEPLSPFDQSDARIQCKVSAIDDSFITWRVYRPRCKAWESLRNHTDAGIRIEEDETSFCMQTSTLTIFNYRERGYEGSAIFCSTATPNDDATDSAHLIIPGNSASTTEDWTLNADLMHVSAATNYSDIQLQCTANAFTGPTISWRVYRSKCGVWESLLKNETKDGVYMEQRSPSPCVELSILTIMNYRERGYSGSVVECSTFTPGNDRVEVNFSIPEIKTDEQIEDWTLQLHSLERLTENINQLDLQLSCTASASSGPSIAWHVHFSLCDVWETLHSMTELGVKVEDHAASPCLKRSKLTISEYAERGYQGAVFKCLASATGASIIDAKKITPLAHPLSDTHNAIRRLPQLSVRANDSNLHLLCTSSTTINSMIVWRVYQSRCGIWENFRIDTKEGVALEYKTLSSCVQTSTLTIFSFLQDGYNGAIIECSVTDPQNSANYSANYTISGNETDGDTVKQQIKIDSLVEVTQGVNQSNKLLLCAAIGSSIEWRVYVSNLEPLVINDTDSGVLIERNMVSPCVFSSTLTILNYREHRYAGSVVMCTTSILGNTGNHSANFTLPSVENVEDERAAEMNCTSLKLEQLAAGAHESDGQFLCTVLGNANISYSWQVTTSQCGHLDVVNIDASTGTNAQRGTLSQFMQNSTLTMTNYFNEGFEWSVITCSTFDPGTRMNCSVNLTIAGADEAQRKSPLEGVTLTNITEGLNQSDIRLLCRASTVSDIVGFRWQVYQPACRLQRPLLQTEAGVHIKEWQVSPCVRSSLLEISDYRERGYGGSTILCKSTCAEKGFLSSSANYTVQDFFSGEDITHSNDGDLNIFKQIENVDRDTDICGATRIYEEEEKVVTVIALKTEKGEYTAIDTELDNQVYSVKIPGIESAGSGLLTVISVYKSHGNFSGSTYSSGNSDKSLTFGSRIIEVTVLNGQGSKITDFSDAHVSLTFPVQGIPGYEPVCSFNSGQDNDWATEGCAVSNFNGYENSNWNGNDSVYITCSCDHLTHFAVLLQISEVEQTFDTHVLDVLTQIGLAFSILCLAVTLMVYTILRLTSIRIVTHANLAFALMISDVIFFFIDTENAVGCTLVAILLHYFLLAAFTWMALEGAFLYVKVTPTFRWKIRLPIWLLIGWGLPFVVVAISAAVNFKGYAGNGRCWLSFADGFVWAFLAPVISIILVNTCFLIRLIAIFFSLKANKDKSEAKKLKAGLRLAIILEPLLGIPWVLGFFYTGKETVVFAYAFVIFNSFQGVFVFLGQCIFDQEVRNSFKSRSSKVQSVSIPQDSTSSTLASKQASVEH